jgi:2-succinyl-5-enolpyruvyl-6-hydroxy-3-cyclohexene-1-carboxylate synthase
MKTPAPPNMNFAWSQVMISELIRLGVSGFFVAPGSRSSPLAWTVAELAGDRMTVHFDERGLAFMALGHARAIGKPAVIITTSGSAVANLFPAVCEAAMDEVPLILLTADRPPELRNCGANQAMDQINFFGTYARWFVDVECPDANTPPEELLATVEQSYRKATQGHPGPVHLNQMFREPLHREKVRDGADAWIKKAARFIKGERSFTSAHERLPASGDVDAVTSLIASARRGIVVAGASSGEEESRVMLAVAERLGWPLLPDIRSGVRLRGHDKHIMTMADQVLLKESKALHPDVVLHLGGRVTSKRIMGLMRRGIVAHVSSSVMPVDPDHVVRERLVMELDALLKKLPSTNCTPAKWLADWKKRDDAVGGCWREMSAASGEISEPIVAAMISLELKDGEALYLASSMPVRDMDMYGVAGAAHVAMVANRGVSGIDGTIASAVGFARGSGGRVTLIIGDLAFLHDVNSLALVRNSEVPVRIILLNNNGGGIFKFLPVASESRHFEACFGTPHDLGDFRAIAAQFDLGYAKPETVEDFKQALSEDGHMIIEVQTNRDENHRVHLKIQAMLRDAW